MPLPPLDPALPVPAIATVVGGAAAASLIGVWRGRPLRPRWLKAPRMLLRLAALALLGVILLNPSLTLSQHEPASRSLVLIDKSASMSLGAAGQPTRWQEAVQWVGELTRGAIAAGLQPPTVIPFDGTAQPLASGPEGLARVEPKGRETKLAGALEQMLGATADAPPDHILVVSDGGAQDRAALPRALAHAHALGVPISTHVVGSDTPPRNAWIAAVQAPRIVRPNSRVTVHVALAATGFTSSESLPLLLKNEEGVVVAQSEFRLPPGSPGGEAEPVERTLVFDGGLRTARYTLELAPGNGEVALDDNRFAFTVEIATTKLRVLFVEGTHVKRTVGTMGHALNDMELMTRAWDATGEIEYECLTPVSEYLNQPNIVGVTFANGEMIPDKARTFPTTREAMYRFDVMLISDVPVGNFSQDQMKWVVDWVAERGGGFLMAGGYTSFDVGHYDKTPWEKIIPVNILDFGAGLDESWFKIAIPEAVRNHPIWRISPDPEENAKILDAHPMFTGMNHVRRAKPGALVLATRPDRNNEPVFAAQNYGRGRSMAFLPDPNGGWARFYVSWGPPGGPPQGPHTELGHGDNFRVHEEALHAATGPMPPHPAPWYGQFWVNTVKWLGENSIRWRRDKLAGRAVAAQAQPGKDLPVAAEVLAVTGLDELLALNVGARLDRPGSPRVRLEYDRDRREFLGRVPVPTDVTGEEVAVLFDAAAGAESLTDTARVGVSRTDPEFTDTAPDRTFMEELARAGGGRALQSPAEAVELGRKFSEQRARQSTRSWQQPLWPHWPWWAAAMLLLALEWSLRRVGTRAAASAVAMLAALAMFSPASARAQAAEAEVEEKKDVPALVEQLGARLVRERDEAEEKLAKLPNAAAEVRAAAEHSPKEEVRLRAGNILHAMQRGRWHLEETLFGHRTAPPALTRAVVVAPDGRHFFTRGQDYLRVWDAETLKPGLTLGEPSSAWRDWQRDGPVSTLALSPDGKNVVTTNDFGRVSVNRWEDGAQVLQFQNMPEGRPLSAVNERALWGAAFFPDGRRLVIADRSGAISFWDLVAQQLVHSERPSVGGRCGTACAVAISPNGRFVAVCADMAGEPDYLFLWDMEKEFWSFTETMPDRAYSLVFNHDGTELLCPNRSRAIFLWSVSADGQLSQRRSIGRYEADVSSAIFAADEKSIFVTTAESKGQLSQWDIATNEELWRCDPLESTLNSVAKLGADRLVAVAMDAKVRIWRRRQDAP